MAPGVRPRGYDVTRVFLHLPSLAGHRRVYCREFCDYFLSRGFSVTVATRLSDLAKSRYLDELREHPRVWFVANPVKAGDKVFAQLRALGASIRQANAGVIFLAEADEECDLLSAQIVRPAYTLPGRRIGLFIRSTNFVHELPSAVSGRLEQFVRTIYTLRPLGPTQPRIFHEIVTRRFPVLDAALCLDEVFVASQNGRYVWLPDVGLASEEGQEANPETAFWQVAVSDFLVAQGSRPVVAYTGTADRRRGYSSLLRFALDIGGCFIHCGTPLSCGGGEWDEAHQGRSELVQRHAILESGRPYDSFETAAVTLRAARCVVLPYPRHLGSSGVMLQALAAGRPVLVPDQGLMGWRVRSFGLGLTYVPGDWRDLRYKFSLLQAAPPDLFADRIRRFLAYFGRVQLERAMDHALGLVRTPPCTPAALGGDAYTQLAASDRSEASRGDVALPEPKAV